MEASCLTVFLVIGNCLFTAGAITSTGQEGQVREVRRGYDDESNSKPIKFDNESGRYEDLKNKNKERDRNTSSGIRDSQTSSSGQYENGYSGVYGPPEDTNIHHGINHGPTYVSAVPFNNHGDRDNDYNYYHNKPYSHGGHGGPPYQPHYGPDPHALALKGILFPLAGVALLGAAAALVSNPVLLQLGVISGRRRRRSIDDEVSVSQDFIKSLDFDNVSYRSRKRLELQ